MKIFKTNWINVVGVFVAVLGYAIWLNLVDNIASRNIFESILPALFLVCLYGCMFWGLFILLLLVFDLILIVNDQKNPGMKLMIESIVISIPFIYWSVRYSQGIFVAGVVAFFLTQYMRQREIEGSRNE